jgi:hypothetical protein
VDEIYVLHYTRSVGRRDHIDALFKSMGIRATLVTPFDREDLNASDRDCILHRERRSCVPFRCLTESEISLAFKFLTALHDMVRKGHRHALLFEDDVVFAEARPCSPNPSSPPPPPSPAAGSSSSSSDTPPPAAHDSCFVPDVSGRLLGNALDHLFAQRQLPDMYDMVMLGSCFGALQDAGVALSEHVTFSQTGRCGHATLVSRKGALNLLRSLPVRGPIDWMMNFVTGAFEDLPPHLVWRNPLSAHIDSSAAFYEVKPTQPSAVYQYNPPFVFQATRLERKKQLVVDDDTAPKGRHSEDSDETPIFSSYLEEERVSAVVRFEERVARCISNSSVGWRSWESCIYPHGTI